MPRRFRRRVPFFLALPLALGGCVLFAPTVDPPGRAASGERRTVMLQGGFLEVVIDFPADPPGPKPAVISYLEDARPALHAAGFVVVSYAMHWELLRGLAQPPPSAAPVTPPAPPAKTYGKWLLASPSPKTIGRGYLGLIDSAARGTIPQILDLLASEPEVDPARIGIAGFSTNGFTALHAASVDPRLRAVVALAACGDYHRFLHRSTLAMAGEPLDLDPAYDAWLRDVSPARHPERLVHAAVLLVNGRRDLPIPYSCAERTARALRRAYRRAHAPERFRFVVVDEGHAVDDRGRREALAWLVRWLRPADGTR
jgi:dienelactone hydrolase